MQALEARGSFVQPAVVDFVDSKNAQQKATHVQESVMGCRQAGRTGLQAWQLEQHKVLSLACRLAIEIDTINVV